MTARMRETWDGKPIASQAPYGAAVVVYRRAPSGPEFLVLHRAHHGTEYEGDWAWTPPSGARLPGEAVEACARRELLEEAGLEAPLRRVERGKGEWAIFCGEVGVDAKVQLHDHEHDRFEWVSFDEAVRRCRPRKVARGIELAGAILGLGEEET